jgi:hypothetical protein
MDHYNSNKDEVDKVVKLEKGVRSYSEEIIQANGILRLMLELIEQRAGKISLMVQKAENLRKESKCYFNTAKKVTKKARCNKYVLIIGIILIVLVRKFDNTRLSFTFA